MYHQELRGLIIYEPKQGWENNVVTKRKGARQERKKKTKTQNKNNKSGFAS